MTKKQIKEEGEIDYEVLAKRNEKIAKIILAKLSRAEQLMFNEYVENELLIETESNK
jgi:hypothetical protein